MCCALLTLVCPYGNRMAVPVRSAGKHLSLGVRTHWGGANLWARGNVRGAYGAPEGPAKGHRQEARRSECRCSCMCGLAAAACKPQKTRHGGGNDLPAFSDDRLMA